MLLRGNKAFYIDRAKNFYLETILRASAANFLILLDNIRFPRKAVFLMMTDN